MPCTPRGIVELLRRYDVPIAGAEVVVVGRGVTVGRPLGLLLTRRSENATVTLCHTGTRDLRAHLARADIIVAAAGVPGLVTADSIRAGAAVLDVGITRTGSGTGRRRVTRGRRGRRPPGADAGRHRSDDPGDAAGQRRRAGRGPSRSSGGLTVAADEPPVVRLDGEGNPIDDQPLIERTIDQWPLALVLVGLAAGLVTLSFYDFRVGSIMLGASVVFGAALRMVLPRDRAGLLAIRSRPVDLVTMYGLGIALTTVAVLVPPAR